MFLKDQTAGWPEVGIYVGSGASHSWTWFADIFDRAGLYSVSFLTETEIEAGDLSGCDVFFVSGGDTFAIAEGLGRSGAEEIKKFVGRGGTYIGTCAGAYLPLNSSLLPLDQFNFISSRIVNLSKNLPAPKQRAEKFCTAYGCRYVFHPVRAEVTMKLTGLCADEDDTVKAPLYGGPVLRPSDDIEVLAKYAGFTDKTEFLIDDAIAHKTVIGNIAAARKSFGQGTFYLFGPHFEHPAFTDANRILFKIILHSSRNVNKNRCRKSSSEPVPGQDVTKKTYDKFLSSISNARIVALAMERSTYTWLIGTKVYDPEKIRVFLEAIWHRARQVQSTEGYKYIHAHELSDLKMLLKEITNAMKQLKAETDSSGQSCATATNLFILLREATAKFLAIYFRLQRDINFYQTTACASGIV